MPILLILAAAVSCGTDDPIRLGFVATLSGRTAEMGLEEMRAVELAVGEINAAGGIAGRPVEVIRADDRNDPDIAREVVGQLLDSGVQAVIGHSTSAMTMATYDLAASAGVPFVSPSTSTTLLNGLNDHFFRLTTTANVNAAALADYMHQVADVENPIIIRDSRNAAYTNSWTQAFEESFRTLGGTPLPSRDFDSTGSVDYSGIIMDVLGRNPDSIVFAAAAIDTALLSQQVRKYDLTVPLFSSSWAKTEEIVFYGGSAVEGMVFARANRADDPLAAPDAFTLVYRNRFGTDSGFAGRQAYESVLFLAEGLHRLEGQSYDDLTDALASIRVMEGTLQTLRFNEYGDVEKPEKTMMVRDGRFIDAPTE